MDLADLDLMVDACVLDVDLPTFLNDYRLPEERPFGDIVGGASTFNSFIDAESYTVNDIEGGNKFFTKFNGLEPFSLLCTENSSPTNKTASPPHQRQNESPSSFLAPWHENFVDLEDEFAIFDVRPTNTDTTTTFLQNVIWQAEIGGNVDDFLDIVDESSAKNSDQIQNPQQIFEEIYRECNQIEASPPRLVSECELNDGEAVFDVLEYYSPSVGANSNGAESDDGSASRSPNYTPSSVDGSEATMADFYSDLDHNFAAHGSISKKYSKKNDNARTSSRGGASIKKKSQNRVAASRYRSKKKTERVVIESEVSILEGRNVQLKTTVDDLQREISYLKGFLSEIRAAKGVKNVKKKKFSK